MHVFAGTLDDAFSYRQTQVCQNELTEAEVREQYSRIFGPDFPC
jgi:hypothetical protein